MIIFTSCEKVIGEGALVTETRTTRSFDGIESQVSANVVYAQGTDYKVELTAQQNILKVCRKLEEEGRIVIAGAGEEML